MWVGGDALMFGLMMLVFLMWSRDERPAANAGGWLETARRTSMGSLVAGQQGTDSQAAASPVAGGDWSGHGGIDDDEHLAAYNAFLARLNESEPGRKR
jgi:hypothetical protein